MAKNNETRKPKSSGINVSATIPKEQYKVIEKLDGILGVGVKGVVANIINTWLHQQGWFNELIKERVKK